MKKITFTADDIYKFRVFLSVLEKIFPEGNEFQSIPIAALILLLDEVEVELEKNPSELYTVVVK